MSDVVAFGGHPDDLEVVMGGTAVTMVRKGLSVLFVDRTALALQDRLIQDTVEARVEVARLLRIHRPRIVFTTGRRSVRRGIPRPNPAARRRA